MSVPSGEEIANDLGEAQARRERLAAGEQAIRFRSLRDRGGDDQREAVQRGYDSVEQLAIDELGQAYHELLETVTRQDRAIRTIAVWLAQTPGVWGEQDVRGIERILDEPLESQPTKES